MAGRCWSGLCGSGLQTANLLILALLLSSCGFHLRGTNLNSSIPSAYVDAARHVTMDRTVRETLEVSGIDVVDDRGNAAVVINLLDSQQEQRTMSVTEDIRTAEYALTVKLRYTVKDAGGRELVPDRWVEASRIYRLDRENLVASSQEEALLLRELEQELVGQIIRSLEAAARKAPADGAG
jgi:LPS-assembly lipoprotein